MKTYCLVPSVIAEKHIFPNHSREQTSIKPLTSVSNHSPSSKVKDKPSLETLVRLALQPSQHDYGISLVKSLDQNPNVTWNESGDLDPPFKGLNIIDLITTLSNRKAKFSPEKKPLVKMLFNLTGLNPRSIKNSKEKVDLLGGGGGGRGRGTGRCEWVPY